MVGVRYQGKVVRVRYQGRVVGVRQQELVAKRTTVTEKLEQWSLCNQA